MSTTVIRGKDCDQDITNRIQVYTGKEILCEICNYRVGKGEEVPRRKPLR